MADPNDYAGEAAFLSGGGEVAALIARRDWAMTPLGPLHAWPDALKAATAMVIHASLAMSILVGEDAIEIYNDAYAELIGARHPGALGARARDTWPTWIIRRAVEAGRGGGNLSLRDVELTVDRSGAREQAWLNIDGSPVLDIDGRSLGVLIVAVETTDRVLAKRRLAEEALRQRRLFEQAPGFVCILQGPDQVIEFVNDTYREMFGKQQAVVGVRLRDASPNMDAKFLGIIDQVYRSGERYIFRAAPIRVRANRYAPRRERFIDLVLEPITDDHGEVTGVFCMGVEVTEQVRAQAAVRDSERRLSAALEIARLGAFSGNLETQEMTLDRRAREIFGFEPDEPIKVDDIISRIDPRDLALAIPPPEAGLLRHEVEYRINLPDGTARKIVSLSDALYGPDGKLVRLLGVFDDVTERRRAEKRQRLLINELNHRVKNTLATVQSIAAQTLRSAPDLPRAREAFEARLMALAAAHDLLTAESWHGARLSDVVASTLAPFETVRRPQISRSGRAVWLTAQRALALSMALHELATNAVKYGALSVPEGRVAIRWTVSDDHCLTLSWVEKDGPPVKPPERSGFGTRLLQRSLARELGGDVIFDFAPEGVRCEIHCKITDARPSTAPEPIEV